MRRIEPCPVIVVEGILLLAVPALRDVFDLRLYVDTDDDVRLIRRIKRDMLERGRDIGSIETQYMGTVRAMHRLHVEPSKQHAHLIIPEGGENAPPWMSSAGACSTVCFRGDADGRGSGTLARGKPSEESAQEARDRSSAILLLKWRAPY